MRNLKFQIHFWLFLLGVVIHSITGQTPVGTINVDGKEVEIFYKIKGTSTTTIPPVVVTTPVPVVGTDLQVVLANASDCFLGKKKISLKPAGGSGNYQIRYGNFPNIWYDGVNTFDMNAYAHWVVFIKDKSTGQILKINIESGECPGTAKFDYQLDNGAVTVPPIIEQENNQVESTPVILPDNQTPTYEGFAEIGKEYQVGDKFKLHASSVETTNMAQHYWIKKDGKTIFELNSTDGWSPAEIYFGNHPIETIIPVSDGNYEFYFKNTTKNGKNVIVGVIGNSPGDAYTQYAKGGLAKTMKWQLLKPGESTQFTLYLEDKCKKDSPLGTYKIQVPVYENGKLCLNKLLTGKGTYIDGNGQTRSYESGIGNESIPFNTFKEIKIFKNTDPSKNIVFKVQVGDQYGKGSITVLEKNGLDLMPDQVLLSAWNISYYKIFNNRSDGYEDSPDYKAY